MMADKSGWHGLVFDYFFDLRSVFRNCGGEEVLWVIVFTAAYGSVLHQSVELTAQCRPCCFRVEAAPYQKRTLNKVIKRSP
jgi:hypothetical protein